MGTYRVARNTAVEIDGKPAAASAAAVVRMTEGSTRSGRVKLKGIRKGGLDRCKDRLSGASGNRQMDSRLSKESGLVKWSSRREELWMTSAVSDMSVNMKPLTMSARDSSSPLYAWIVDGFRRLSARETESAKSLRLLLIVMQSRPLDMKLKNSLMIGQMDVPLEDKLVSVVYGTDMVNTNMVHFACSQKETAQEWAEELLKYSINLLALNSSALTYLDKLFTRFQLVLNNEGKVSMKKKVYSESKSKSCLGNQM
ncbi:1-phosphatidylinositol 4,5-bisphosphate phosphodiesterase beta-1-like [Elysia marginata]|uniref:1-phosphatidylinositol 4,5-bisphosphate phosphodiesterase beta-1-like n=1 Tax=Elysia marginata TaxID=1093978 RepID=A0AAV4ELY8_9GAST|nr:1-phosphatidylinositol 4,5-bisphosphate phosphodiesterase beta-1-like [Elysia marginata]